MKWGDGLQVDTSTLRSEAGDLRRSHAALTAQMGTLDSIDVSHWQGSAAGAERKVHEQLLRTFRRETQPLEPMASALETAANSFDNIQQAQRSTIDMATRWRFSILESGWIRNDNKWDIDPRRAFVYGRLVGSVTSITFRLNGTDIALAGKLVAQDLKSTVTGWGDAIRDGAEWALDKGSDLLVPVKDFFARRAQAAGTALERLRELDANPPQWLIDKEEHGKVPFLSQVVGRGIHEFGLKLGVIGNALTGRDLHIFDDGEPYVGKVTPDEPRTIKSINDVMAVTMEAYERGDSERNSITVTAVETPDGVKYIASIPGTAEGTLGARAWTGAPSGLDWAANAMHVGSGPTAATEAASDAIQRAINADIAERLRNGESIPPGKPEVLLTGHSQGGIVAGQLISDDRFLQNVEVKGILSAGSPQETLPMRTDVPVYNFQTQYDPIPRADLEGKLEDGSYAPPRENVTNITLPHSGTQLSHYTPWYTHLQKTYVDDVEALTQRHPDGTGHQGLSNLYRDFGGFFEGEARTYKVEFGREVAN